MTHNGEDRSAAQLLSVRGVHMSFKRRHVLQGVDLDLEKGCLMLLRGPNGSGKSTFLKILATLLRPDEGRVLLEGEDVLARDFRAGLRIGMLSHGSFLYEQLTATENLSLYGGLYGFAADDALVSRLLTEVNLDWACDQLVRTFSHGMRKRLTLARLMLQKPSLLLLDEPYSGLDEPSCRLVDVYLEGFVAGGGAAVLVTHLRAEDLPCCGAVAYMEEGRLRVKRGA